MSSNPKQLYSVIVSTLALVVALGGTGAYAVDRLAKNSVTTKQIKNGTIRSQDLKDRAVSGAKVADGSLEGPDLAGDTLTGSQVKESSLGKVPSAASVDTVQHFSLTPALNQPVVLMTRGPLTLKARCFGPVGSVSAELLLLTSADNSSWKTGTSADTDMDVAEGDVIVMFDTSGPGTVLDDLVAQSASGPSFMATAALAGQISTCSIDVTVIG